MIPTKRAPTHPGQMLLYEFLEPMHLTQKDFASHLGWTYARLNEIINGHRNITPESALALSEALGTTPEFWLDLQTRYDLWCIASKKLSRKPKIKRIVIKKMAAG